MKIFKYSILVIAGLFAGLLLAEGLARCFLTWPTRQIALLRMRAPDLQMDSGTDLKNPNYNPFLQRRPFSEWICDGKTPEPMNNEGFRDRAFVLHKKPDTTRIALVGDSFTEGWMTPRIAAYPRVLESALGPKCEIMNFGLANRSPLRYLALYDQIVRKYHPDVVFVCLYRNDIAEDEALRHYVTFDSHGVPDHFDYTRYFRDTPRMPQTRWERRLDKWQWYLCQHSCLYPYAAVGFTVNPEFRKRMLEAPLPAVFDTLWPNTEKYLLNLKGLIEKDGVRFLLAYAPDADEFTAPDKLYAHLARFAAENQTPFFDAKLFLASTNVAALYLPRDGHFSAEGHRQYARDLGLWLERVLNWN